MVHMFSRVDLFGEHMDHCLIYGPSPGKVISVALDAKVEQILVEFLVTSAAKAYVRFWLDPSLVGICREIRAARGPKAYEPP